LRWSYKTVAIAMKIEPPCYQPVARSAMLDRKIHPAAFNMARSAFRLLRRRRRQTPLLTLRLHQFTASGNSSELFQQQSPLASTA
jgi:hypothetical protein